MNEDAKRWLYWGIPALVLIGVAVALYYGRSQRDAAPDPVAATATEPPSTEPPVKHPIDPPANQQPLPELGASDGELRDSISGLFGRSLEPYLVPQNIVKHIVVTVDNLPRKKTAVQLWPVKPMGGTFVTEGSQELTLGEGNFARYSPLIKIVQNANAAQLAETYRHYYPLFQQAYVDLGYPEGYFNDRLIEVIDHLLATPEVEGPIRLTQPGVFYQFADSSLEELSAGQKTLVRMGSQNSTVVKAKLRELRREVARQERSR